MLRVTWRSRRWRGILAIVLSTPVLAIALVFWRASQVRDEAAAEVLSKSQLPFRIVPVERVVPAAVEPIAAIPGFRDLATYKDMIAVSARAGLFLYSRNGALLRSYRAGMELPPAELGSMSAGIAAGASEPELFIATRGEGVLAFNGTRIRQILPADAGLRIVTAVLVLGSGRVLLGTERHGLLVFDGRRLTPFHARLNTAHITALAGNDGDLWIGTLGNGVFHYRGGQLDDLLAALPDPQVLSLAVADGAAYVGTPLGVVEFRDGQPAAHSGGWVLRPRDRAARRDAPRGHGGRGHRRRCRWTRGRRPRAPSEGAAPFPVVRLANLEGDVYAVGESAIYRYDPSQRQWRPVLTEGGALMADRNVASLGAERRPAVDRVLRSRAGRGGCEAGARRASRRRHALLHQPDRGGRRRRRAPRWPRPTGWCCSIPAAQPRQIMGRKDGLLSDHVTDVAFREGGMVVATPAGLSFVDRTGVRSLYVFHGLVNNHVYTVAARGSQTVAGTLGGVSVLDDDTVRANYTTANSRLKHNWITALVRVGDEWFAGTYGAGVLRLDASGEWHSFPDLKDGFVVNPNAMVVSGGQVYAGSLDRGLFVFDRASGRWSNTPMGLPSKNVTALAAGGGYLYAGTDNGLVRIAEGALR